MARRRRTAREIRSLTAKLTDKDAMELAVKSGCRPAIGKTPSGARWKVSCECGWETPTTRATRDEAARQLMTHLRGRLVELAEQRLHPSHDVVNGGASSPESLPARLTS